jgi:hypothetical protein
MYAITSKNTFKNQLIYFGLSSLLLLSGCGGSGSENTEFLGGNSDINVALASNGSSISTNYDNQQSKVIDGDTSTSESWAGNAINDYVKIDFKKTRFLKEIKIFTNDNANQANKRIEISTDNSTWKTTAQSSGNDIDCTSFSTNTTNITCTYSSRQQARYLRFTTLTTDLLNIYEIQAFGY